MKKNKKTKEFLNLPQFPGGKTAFREFVANNLKYPPEALQNKIEGKVHVSFEVNDNGEVVEVEVTKGIGYGCDEEAMRVVRLLRYDAVKNRGVRLTSSIKSIIEFKLNQAPQPLSYSYVATPTPKPEKQEKPKEKFGYTIKLNH
ncbi:MAG: energy transducer TonB [Bacteroidetes bacterium]|nr:energy transducer TonB [Bacteroidota bacterium]